MPCFLDFSDVQMEDWIFNSSYRFVKRSTFILNFIVFTFSYQIFFEVIQIIKKFKKYFSRIFSIIYNINKNETILNKIKTAFAKKNKAQAILRDTEVEIAYFYNYLDVGTRFIQPIANFFFSVTKKVNTSSVNVKNTVPKISNRILTGISNIIFNYQWQFRNFSTSSIAPEQLWRSFALSDSGRTNLRNPRIPQKKGKLSIIRVGLNRVVKSKYIRVSRKKDSAAIYASFKKGIKIKIINKRQQARKRIKGAKKLGKIRKYLFKRVINKTKREKISYKIKKEIFMERRKNYFGGRYYLPHRKFEKLATSLLVIPFIQDQNVIIKKEYQKA